MSRKRKFIQISKEDENLNDLSYFNHCLLQIKEQRELKNENGKMIQKLFMNPAEGRTLQSLNLKFKGVINMYFAK